MAAARLPGIYFETVAPPVAPLLPRMDIAAFAGFLPSGPIGLPFAVEDPDRFADIFGADLPLAWDTERKELLLAQTPPAVRTFFRNGGVRCWVLRLAGNALSNAWTIPGLLQWDSIHGFTAGSVVARSEGSWSDGMTVNATLLESPLPSGSLDTSGSAPQVSGINPGGMVQLYFPLSGTVAYHSDFDPRWFWFRQAAPAEFASSPPASPPDEVVLLGPGTETPLPSSEFGSQGGELVLTVTRAVALTVQPGSWLRVRFGSRLLFVQVELMDADLAASSPPSGGSPPSAEMASLTSTLAWWRLDPAAAWATNRTQTVQVSTVTFELWAWPPGDPVQRIANLGFSPDHPRYWGLLPTDWNLYAPMERPSVVPWTALANDIDNPRFDLAGPSTTALGLPLGMTGLVRSDFSQAASQPGGTALERDGLQSFTQDLFIDPRLNGSTAATLLQDAFYYQYQAPSPAPPSGIQALLNTDEVSLIAVPDAIQSGWRRSSAASPTLAAPASLKVSPPGETGDYTVSWDAVPDATGYSLQEATDTLFTQSLVTRDAGAARSLALSNGATCPLRLYYRAYAYGAASDGPFSETASVLLGTGDFEACREVPLDAPAFTLIEEGNRILLEWTPGPGGADGFTLQTALDPQFASASVLYQGSATEFPYWHVPGPSIYFRVNAQRSGSSSSWSATASTAAEPVSPWEVLPPGAASRALLLTVHRALARIGAARGDLVGIISLPISYNLPETVAYPAMLAALVAPEDTSGTMLSYLALYHPWVVTPDTIAPAALSLRTQVPDGAVCGLIASQTISSAAWDAPANLAVDNAVALEPVLPPGAPQAFDASQVNLIAQLPGGFIVTSQDTLVTLEPDLRALNVRRLLILMRRLALREGVRYVFENLSASFRRAVSRQFTQWMQVLMEGGAFAGQTAQDCYRVVTDGSVNTQASLDQGRFVVELRVAPSVPMRFLTVRLVQSGGQLTLEEA